MQSIIQNILYLLVIFIPLTFTTINSELFEFPKFILLLSGTLVIMTAWLVDIFYYKNHSRRPHYPLSLTDYAILLILLTQALATLFSINPYTSFWGYYSRYHQGLVTTICYTILYFAATIYLDKKSVQKIIKISLGTAFFVSLYTVAQRLGIDKSLWIQDVVNRPFSTLGQPNWLAAYLLPNLFLSLYLLPIKNSKNYYLLSTISYLLIFTALLLTRSRSGFIAFVLSYAAYYLLLARQFGFSKIKKQLSLSTFYVILVTIFISTPYTPSIFNLIQSQPARLPATAGGGGTQLDNGGTESGDIRKIVWTGALDLIKKYPLLGTGPETFAYTYYWTRPPAHNQTSEWDFLYNKAHNEYLNIAATTGLLGLTAYLALHFALFKTSLTKLPRTKKTNQSEDDQLRALYPVLGATVISFAVTNFFGFSVIPVYLLMILLSTLPAAIKNKNSTSDFQLGTWHLVLIIPLLYPARLFLADTNYARGKAYLDANQPAVALPYLQKATASRPGLDLYHSALGEAYAQLGQKEQALNEAEINRKQNPYHLNYHKSRAKIYLTLASVESSYHETAASELEQARVLAPTDPKLAYNLGLVYSRLNDIAKAETNLRDAIALKPNYAEPYYALTLLYEQTKQASKLPDLLSSAKTNLATYSSQLKEKIEKYTQ